MKAIERRARQLCLDLEEMGNLRRIRYRDEGVRVDFTSNDYLGVVKNGLLRASLAKHASLCGTGGASSRLMSGSTGHHRALEEKLADRFGYEAALVFSSGFMANYGLCSALKEVAEVVFVDKRVHASVVDGLMQSMGGSPEIRSFRHNSAEHYSRLAGRDPREGAVTITESLFSMTGRRCNERIIDEAGRQGLLVVDEAHSLGAVEPRGQAIFGKGKGVDITVGAFGKAFGVMGGFVLSSAAMRTFLVNRCRSFIFTTALPEVYAAVACDAIDLVVRMDEERGILAQSGRYLAGALESAGFKTSGDAHIIAVYCRGSDEAVRVARLLSEEGIALYAVRPPTVPPKEVLLRVSLNSCLGRADLDRFLDAIIRIRLHSPHLFAGSA